MFATTAQKLLTQRPLLDKGKYKGIVTDVILKDVFTPDLPGLRIEDEEEWSRTAIHPKTGKEGTMVKTGRKVLRAYLQFNAELTDPKAEEKMGVDSPKVYGGKFNLYFLPDGQFDGRNNTAFNDACSKLGIDFNAITERVAESFEFDNDVLVPEADQAIENIVQLYNAKIFFQDVLEIVMSELQNKECYIEVTQVNGATPDQLRHVIDSGVNRKRDGVTGSKNPLSAI